MKKDFIWSNKKFCTEGQVTERDDYVLDSVWGGHMCLWPAIFTYRYWKSIYGTLECYSIAFIEDTNPVWSLCILQCILLTTYFHTWNSVTVHVESNFQIYLMTIPIEDIRIDMENYFKNE